MDKFIILAGNGLLPINIIKELKKKGINFFILIISDSGWDKELEKYNFKVIKLGKVISELYLLKNNGFHNIIFAGSINRPNISNIKPDLRSIKFIPKLIKVFLKGGDNYLLKFIINELEKMNFKVYDIKTLAPNLFLGNGNFTNFKPSKINNYDIKRGKTILNELSKYDIGQSIIVQQGTVVGIESIEGTDELIKRCSKYIKRKGEKATLIKLFKKKQEMKADLPTIGLKTLQLCNKNFMGGIVFSANKTLFIDNKKIIENMKKNRMFLLGIDV